MAWGVAAAGPALAAHEVSQTIELQPGWNAVYLEVQPASNDTVSVFQPLPLSSAWTWIPRDRPAQYIDNLNEALHTDPHWLVFFPTNRYEKMFNDLFRVYANRCYFLKLASASSYTWTVTGRPAVPAPFWQPNGYNLAGFPLTPSGPLPSVQQFFASDASLNTQAVYRLGATGAWERVAAPGSAAMRAGEALWVYAGGESTYAGPLQVAVSEGDGLDFGGSVDQKTVTLKNLGAASTVVEVRNVLGASGPVQYGVTDAGTGSTTWTDLPDPLAFTLPSGSTYGLRLAVQRNEFIGGVYETTIEVSADNGTRVRIPLHAESSTP